MLMCLFFYNESYLCVVSKIYVFNPDHELSLASDDNNFQPKKNVTRLQKDLALLPLWLEDNCSVLQSDTDTYWHDIADRFGLKYLLTPSIDYSALTEVFAWGWNKQICSKLMRKGVSHKLLPDSNSLSLIRRLTERRTAVQAMKYLISNISDNYLKFLPHLLPELLVSSADVERFVARHIDVVLKTPLSCSGKGLCFAKHNLLSDSYLKRVERLLEQQKYLVAENRYNVVSNFAMEFSTDSDTVTFVGYSLFATKGNAYDHNILVSDSEIEQRLTELIPLDLLRAVRSSIVEFVLANISPFYRGYLGVDMFVYECEGNHFLHPCVEINLRPTMGLVANHFYKNYVAEGRKGIFSVDFFDNASSLQSDHKLRLKSTPAEIVDRKLYSGYLSLCPIKNDTQYRVRVEIL